MMRSLFSGVSGLKNHQTRMDVIGNNISNVNTTGFKSSRVNFTDMLSQTLTGASSPGDNRGGTNPKQIGLGSSVAAVDLLFTNGSVQSTGKNTDLCISGNALFQVKDGSGSTYYTRNGAFEFDAAGNYVQPGNGLFVQGWMANEKGELSTTGETTNIVVPAGKSMASAASETATYANNLNGGLEGHKVSTIKVEYMDGTTDSTVKNYAPKLGSGTITVGGKEYKMDPDIYDAANIKTGDTLTNQKIWSKTVKSVISGTASTLKFSNVDADGTKLYESIAPSTLSNIPVPENGFSVNGYYEVKQEIESATLNTENKTVTLKLKDTDPAGQGFTTVVIPMPEDSPHYHAGDPFTTKVRITSITAAADSKIKVEGEEEPETLAAAFTIDKVDTKYSKTISGEVTAVKRNADGVVFDGKQVKSVSLTTEDGLSVDGLTSVNYAVDEMYYPSVVTTVTVYDSLGGSHDVPVLFTKSDENIWKLSLSGGGSSYIIDEADGTQTEVTLESTNLTFNSSGAYTGGEGKLLMKYANGAADQQVDINLSGLTQYIGSSTVNASTDGHAAGTLSSVSIDTSGVITGTYTNGVKRAEAQVAVAQFNNASGLTKTGDSLYQESNNSGTANVKTAADLGVTITPSALEMSNVDVANEFTDMIITQRGFQGNSKIITVSDEMLETLINMKR